MPIGISRNMQYLLSIAAFFLRSGRLILFFAVLLFAVAPLSAQDDTEEESFTAEEPAEEPEATPEEPAKAEYAERRGSPAWNFTEQKIEMLIPADAAQDKQSAPNSSAAVSSLRRRMPDAGYRAGAP